MNARNPNLVFSRTPVGASRSGFTLLETLISTAISVVVLGALVTLFLWVSENAIYSQEVAWSHEEAMTSCQDIQNYMRQATAITGLSTNTPGWVEMLMPNNSTSRLVYVNSKTGGRDGYMYLTNSARGYVQVIGQGLTQIMQTGYSPPIFYRTSTNVNNMVRIRYRVVDPVRQVPSQSVDLTLAATIDTSVYLRNTTSPAQ